MDVFIGVDVAREVPAGMDVAQEGDVSGRMQRLDAAGLFRAGPDHAAGHEMPGVMPPPAVVEYGFHLGPLRVLQVFRSGVMGV